MQKLLSALALSTAILLGQSAARAAPADDAIAGWTSLGTYVFGTSAVAGTGETAITNKAQLDGKFNYFQNNAAEVTIGSEVQRYTAGNAQTHVFASDRLNLTGVLGGGDASYSGGFTNVFGQISGSINVNSPIDPAQFGFASGTKIEVGNMIVLQSRGIYRVDSIGTDGKITLLAMFNSNTTNPVTNALAVLTPFYALKLAQPTATNAAGTATTMVFDTIPASMPTGMAVGYVKDNAFQRNDDYRAVTVDKTTKTVTTQKKFVFISQPSTYQNPAGQLMIFVPPIRSAQIITKDTFDLKNGDYAFDANVNYPEAVASRQVNTIAELNALPANQPNGFWGAAWLYGKNTTASTTSSDEIDSESWFDFYKGPDIFSAFTHGETVTQGFQLNNDEWAPATADVGAGYLKRLTGPLVGDIRLTKVVRTSAGKVDTYVNGTLVDTKNYTWTNANPAEFIVNLAIGSISGSYSANVLFPLKPSNFNNMKIGVKRLAFYKK
ncbi:MULTISPECIES: hypothetical protein [Rhizobium]|uniref:Choice-of-anchor A family protein n=1 Tax=Rhizobium rhododendri TaxID=2506430 RepID=A0ABY8IIP6_9HYPH|nr:MULTISPECIES: hypothetical protein [Rhizobium]MBZ5761692.1 hypothetical protein [Rhizobium sp. VS19-DR96]MBZ5767800.1 hypothetical protein [Rhizobium sp. VS19-DR129.2]MBZ5773674.1 hypothetical protein [Rhizobium sp. VS19-DRK62.2]MBZ5786417.1 hypothetical protein [Rhizobium sp. VS19-DR121]MBZ5802170.1 hypothetical protein [Rhizobium sp. VS19-DR181]